MNVVDLVKNWAKRARQADAGDTRVMADYNQKTVEQILASLDQPEFKKREAARADFSASINQMIAAGQFEDLVKIRAAFKGSPEKQSLFERDQIQKIADALTRQEDEFFNRRKFELFLDLCDAVSSSTNHTYAIEDNIMRERFLCKTEKRGDDLLRLSLPFKGNTIITPDEIINKSTTFKTIPANLAENTPAFTLMFYHGHFVSAQAHGREAHGIDDLAAQSKFFRDPVLKALRELRTDPIFGPSASAAYADLQDKIADQILKPEP